MPLPFARTAPAVARPTFSRDFAGLKTLDHGVGPAITFTRGSNATFFNAAGTLTTATTDEPRFDHNPSTGASLGLLIEEARTNSIRNSQAGGSTNGVIGSGGVMPTNWGAGTGASSNGISSEIVGTGSENGLAYIDIRVSGTPTANGSANFFTDATNQIAASSGQTWSGSAYVKRQSGSLTNATVVVILETRNSSNVFVADGTSQTITPTNAALNTQRVTMSDTLSDATVAFVNLFVRVAYTSGNPIDLTLRIAAPQLEQGAFPTSYIPTTTAAATRAADSAVVTPISSFYNIQEGTLFSEGSLGKRNAGESFASLCQSTFGRGLNGGFINSTTNDQVGFVFRNSAADAPNINEATDTSTGVVAASIQRFAAGYNSLGHVFGSVLGRAVVSDIADTISPLPVADRLLIGEHNVNGPVPKLNGHIRKLAYWPKRLTNTLLQQLTT